MGTSSHFRERHLHIELSELFARNSFHICVIAPLIDVPNEPLCCNEPNCRVCNLLDKSLSEPFSMNDGERTIIKARNSGWQDAAHLQRVLKAGEHLIGMGERSVRSFQVPAC